MSQCVALKALASSALSPQGAAQAREEESTNPVFANESEGNKTNDLKKRRELHELFKMKKMITNLIAQECPRLDANPPPPPKFRQVASSAAFKSSATSKSEAAYTKTTARNDSGNESDTLEYAPSGTDELSATADKPSAVKKRRSTKRCNDVRNWQAGKLRNSTPERINDDIEEATVRNLHEVVGKMQKLGYAVLMDYKEATDDPEGTLNPKTYNIFKPENEPTAAQLVFHKTPLGTSRQPPVMDTIFEGVLINQANMHCRRSSLGASLTRT